MYHVDAQMFLTTLQTYTKKENESTLELVSEELNHFGLIAGLFRQIRGHTW